MGKYNEGVPLDNFLVLLGCFQLFEVVLVCLGSLGCCER